MSTPLATLRVAGSMVTIHLPSTKPRIDPAWAGATVIEAATAPIKTSVARFRGMKVSPFSGVCVDGQGDPLPSADTGKSYAAIFARLQKAPGRQRATGHVFVIATSRFWGIVGPAPATSRLPQEQGRFGDPEC
jgi:hypothetical protein